MAKTNDLGYCFEKSLIEEISGTPCCKENLPKYNKYITPKIKNSLKKVISSKKLGSFKYVGNKVNLFDFAKKSKINHYLKQTPKNSHFLQSHKINQDGINLKTNKGKNYMVAPQIIGQLKVSSYISFFNLKGVKNSTNLKRYFLNNPKNLLGWCVLYTFHSPVLYYNYKDQELTYITLKEKPNFENLILSWSQKSATTWKNSATLRVFQPNKTLLLQVQFHSKNRTNVCVRINLKNFLSVFKDNFEIEYY